MLLPEVLLDDDEDLVPESFSEVDGDEDDSLVPELEVELELLESASGVSSRKEAVADS